MNAPRRPSSEAGFTLIECLIAIIVLVFGLIGITNLFVRGAPLPTRSAT